MTIMKSVVCSIALLAMFLYEFTFDNNIVDLVKKVYCGLTCSLKNFLSEETEKVFGNDITISPHLVLIELTLITFTVLFFNRYKKIRKRDRILELLQESKDDIRKANEFLEKWRLRRINRQYSNEKTYLDDEPQEIKPLKLEVPILHMAIIDTLGTTRSQPESGDAGETLNCITDTTLLSVASVIDDAVDQPTAQQESSNEDIAINDIANKYLWDVVEEDVFD